MASSTQEIVQELVRSQNPGCCHCPYCQKTNEADHPSHHPIISLSRFQTFSSVLINTVRIDLQKQDLGVFIPKGHPGHHRQPNSQRSHDGSEFLHPLLLHVLLTVADRSLFVDPHASFEVGANQNFSSSQPSILSITAMA